MTPCICVMLIFFPLLSFYSSFCIALDCQGQRGRTIPEAALEEWQKNANGWWVGGRNRWHACWSPLCRSSSQLSTCDGIISIATRSNESFFQLEQTQNILPWASRQCQEPNSIFLAPTWGEWSSLSESKTPGCLTVMFTIHLFKWDSYTHQCRNQWAVNN